MVTPHIKKMRKLLSESVHTQLQKYLTALEQIDENDPVALKEEEKVQERIRRVLERIFTFEQIYEFHMEHLLELADVILGLYPERDQLEEYTYCIFPYLQSRLKSYEMKRNAYLDKLSRAKRTMDTESVEYLDLAYRTWVYTDGYECQQAKMYRLLQQTLQDLVAYKRSNK